jgi:hypothetical protein
MKEALGLSSDEVSEGKVKYVTSFAHGLYQLAGQPSPLRLGNPSPRRVVCPLSHRLTAAEMHHCSLCGASIS